MALSKQDPRLAFFCEQHDSFANLTRTYVLFFFYEDRSVEIRDVKRNALNLKRTSTPSLTIDHFYLGAVLNLFGKVVKLTEHADEVTRQLCSKNSERTVLLISEKAVPSIGRCLSIITEECGFVISKMQMTWVESEMIERFCLPESLAGGRAVIMSCVRTDALQKGAECVQRVDGVFAASGEEEVTHWTQFLQLAAQNPVAVFNDQNSSVVIVKPHVLKLNAGGTIVQHFVDSGLEPTGFMLMDLDTRVVNACLEPYKGVLPDFEETVNALVGPAWIVQFVSLDHSVDVTSVVRELCGPFDPAIAKPLRPKSIRARFGVNRAENAVHCCDLSGEGPFYADLFFKQ